MSMPAERLQPGMDLATLFPQVDAVPPLAVTGLAADSRLVAPGDLFLAIPGRTSHGAAFAALAEERGAAAVAVDPAGLGGAMPALSVPVVGVPGLAAGLGELADRFYGEPSSSVAVTGITGTNGKTTVAWMLAECRQRLGRACGYVGTLGVYGKTPAEPSDATSGLTTPGVVELHQALAGFRDDGVDAAAIEVSSHALDQGRVDNVRFRTAIFTNLSRDHLDYHGTMRRYFEAKARLFLEHDPAVRIINLDSEYGAELAGRCRGNVITVSTRFDRVANGRPFVFVRSVVATPTGSRVHIESSWGSAVFDLSMPGDFNVANAVTVLATLLDDGVSLERATDALAAVAAPPGRLQRVAGEGPRVYVDFAHTPDALELVLKSLKPHVRGRLIVVFGAGGDRDAGKRPLMGRVAERLADAVVLTSDNPRGEEPVTILDDIRAGLIRPERATVIEDRATAIAWAIGKAAAADTILVAGKGHEPYQDIAGEQIPFSDVAVAGACLAQPNEGGQ